MSTSAGPYAALRIPEYRNFILARICITLAMQIQGTVVGWQVYQLTHDSAALAFIGLAEVIPAVGVSLYAGHVVDSTERRKVILWTVSVLLICSLSLLSFTWGLKDLLVSFGTFPIYGVIFISGFARGFLSPANFSFMPQLVPRNLYTNAVSLNSTFWEAASIGGPLLAGLIAFLYVNDGVMLCYAADSLLVFASLMFYFSVPSKPLPPSSIEQGLWRKIIEGLRFVFGNQIILSAISLDMFAVLFGGVVAILPVFADEILQCGAAGLGLLRAAPSVGALLLAVFITHHPIRKHVGKILLACVGGFGLCMIAFALSSNLYLSIFILTISGAFDSVSVIVRSTLIHTLTPENMKGRVAAVNSMFVGSSNELGAAESGFAAKLMRPIPSVIFGGTITLLVVAFTGWKAKKLTQLDSVH